MATEWFAYVNQFDAMLAAAFLTTARNSLSNVFNAINSEGAIPPSPIILMSGDIAENKVSFAFLKKTQ